MKNFITPAIFFFLFTTAHAQKTARIQGNVSGNTHIETIYLQFIFNGDLKVDSAVVEKGKFNFNAVVDDPVLAVIRIKYPAVNGETKPSYERKQFYLQAGRTKIDIRDSLSEATIRGGTAQRDFEYLDRMLRPYQEKNQELTEQYIRFRNKKDQAGMERVEAAFEHTDSLVKQDVYLKFIETKKKSPLSLYVLERFGGYDIDPDVVAPLFEKLPAKDKNSQKGKQFAERLETARKTAVGALAMDFTQNDTLGKPVSLSDFRGKYVLIDFWASWCGPCRAENPNLVKAFNKFKDKNFTVLGVSLDQEGQQKAWMDAIHKDELTWTQVSDLRFWENAVAKQYGIRAIPQNFLIDPNGKIVAKNVRGKELWEKLEQTLE